MSLELVVTVTVVGIVGASTIITAIILHFQDRS